MTGIIRHNPEVLGQLEQAHKTFPSLTNSLLLEEAAPPIKNQISIWGVSIIIIAFIAWASITPIDEMVTGTGQIVPQSLVKVVQHLEGGIVKTCHVKEGDIVKSGQLLLEMDEAGPTSELNQMKTKEIAFQIQAERLRAFGMGYTPNFSQFSQEYTSLIMDQKKVYDAQIEALENQKRVIEKQVQQQQAAFETLRIVEKDLRNRLKAIAEQLDISKKLVDQKLRARTVYLSIFDQYLGVVKDINQSINQQRQAIRATEEAKSRYNDIVTRLQNDAMNEMGKTTAELAQVRDNIVKLEDRVKRLKILSPVNGIVQGLKTQTLRSVVQPGAEIMQIVPIDKLQVESKVIPKDMGNVKVGQNALIKVTAYDYGRFGGVEGKVTAISATTFLDEKYNPYFKVYVDLPKNYVGTNPQHIITPGLTTQTNIKTGEKNLMDYLWKPVYYAFQDSFHER